MACRFHQFQAFLWWHVSISTCFVQSCWSGLRAMPIAALLLHRSLKESLSILLSSWRTNYTHISSQIPRAIAINYAFALLLATTACFFYFSTIQDCPKRRSNIITLIYQLLPNMHQWTSSLIDEHVSGRTDPFPDIL